MKFTLILFVMWGSELQIVSKDFADEPACVDAGTDLYGKITAASQVMDPPLVMWSCEKK